MVLPDLAMFFSLSIDSLETANISIGQGVLLKHWMMTQSWIR